MAPKSLHGKPWHVSKALRGQDMARNSDFTMHVTSMGTVLPDAGMLHMLHLYNGAGKVFLQKDWHCSFAPGDIVSSAVHTVPEHEDSSSLLLSHQHCSNHDLLYTE